MAFDLKRVLKALLFSSSQPLAVKDIQAAFTRFTSRRRRSCAGGWRRPPPGARLGRGSRPAAAGATEGPPRPAPTIRNFTRTCPRS